MNTIDCTMLETENHLGVKAMQELVDRTTLPEHLGAVIWFCDDRLARDEWYPRGFYLSVNDDRADVHIRLGQFYSASYARLLNYLLSPETLMDIPF